MTCKLYRPLSVALALAACGCQGDGDHARAVADHPPIDAAEIMRDALDDQAAIVETTRRTRSAVCGRFSSRGDSAEFVIDVGRKHVFRSDLDPGVDALAAAACTRVAAGSHAGENSASGGGAKAPEKKSGGH